MPRVLNYKISEEYHQDIILSYLRKMGFSRHILSSMKPYKEAILLNGKHAGGRTALSAGDLLTITLPPEPQETKILPVELPLSVLYEDEDLMVVNKSSNMPIHPSIGNYENTLANAIAWYYQKKGEAFTYRCINRLDRDTTGALILAKNALSASILGDAIRNRQIRRTYLALAKGKTPERGAVFAPIARKEASTIEREVNFLKGESALTFYERLDYQNELSLLELHLGTGRTHQIRVHMNYLGYPLPGDFLYHPDTSVIDRQALHSYQLEFFHPITGKPLCFQAPVPADFVQAFESPK